MVPDDLSFGGNNLSRDVRIMGFITKVKNAKASLNEKMDYINGSMQSYAVSRYYMTIAEDRGISYAEAIELCSQDPELSLNAKLADPENIFKCCTKKGKQRFYDSLTPEEQKIFDADKDKNFKRALIKAAKGKA